ncbi:MAG: hypothetical protein V3T16_09110 [Gemmatimonadales bacterium]
MSLPPTLVQRLVDAARLSGTRGQALRTMVPLFLAVVFGVVIAQLGGKVAVGSPEGGLPEIDMPRYDGDVDRDSRQDVVDFARTAPYAGELGLGDDQSLQSGQDTVSGYGPHVRIEPVAAAHRYTPDELAAGRFIGRLINFDPEPYPRLGLGAHDTTYWWVDSSANARWRAVFFSTDPAIQPVTMPVRVEPSATWWQPLARWVAAGGVDEVWATCGADAVCRTD